MKKIVILIVTLVMTAGFVTAQDSGFSVGAEAGFRDLKNKTMESMYIMPNINFNKSLLDNALDVNLMLGVPFGIKSSFWLATDFDITLAYNLGPLSFIVQNELSIPIKENKNKNVFSSIFWWIGKTYDDLTPGIEYAVNLDAGSFYFKADLPLEIRPDAFDWIGMYFSISWIGKNGFGIKIRERNNIKPEIKFFRWVDLNASYDNGIVYVDLDVEIPLFNKGIESTGIRITPEIGFAFTNSFKGYVNLPMLRIGSDYDVIFGAVVGIKKSF